MEAKLISEQLHTEAHQRLLSALEQFVLAGLFLAGILRIYAAMAPMKDTQLLAAALAGAAVLLLCSAGAAAFKKQWMTTGIFGAGVVVFAAVAGIDRIYSGMLGAINHLIGWWNMAHEDGVRYLGEESVQQTELALFSAFFMILMAFLVWQIIRHKMVWALWILAGLLLLLQLLVQRVDLPGVSCLAAAFAGAWLLWLESTTMKRRIGWLAFVTLLALTCSFIDSGAGVEAVNRARAGAGEQLRDICYGKDTLPEGNLYQADEMLKGEEPRLTVTTQQVKSMHLRGFVGGCYEDGSWKMFKKSAYKGERTGMFDWLSEQEFWVAAQYYEYEACEPSDNLENNQVMVENTGARRNYLYMPYSVQKPDIQTMRQEYDGGFCSTRVFGSRTYRFMERSDILPAELIYAKSWVINPGEKQQEQYAQSEQVYRSFVYEHYLELDDEIGELTDKLFWENAKEEDKKSIYAATQHIRSVLEKRVRYASEPEKVPENAEPVVWFLTEGREGNSALFASAAVMAYRSCGIPARYAEGYLLTEQQAAAASDGKVELTSQDSYAWAEVYMDGVGWLPIDVTPGFYLDTYTMKEMVEQPQGIEKTAAVEEDGEEVDQITGDEEASAGHEQITSMVKQAALLIAGILVCLAVFMLLVLLVMEALRALRCRGLKREYETADEMEKPKILCRVIFKAIQAFGIEACLGWQMKETAALLDERFEKITAEEYVRVCVLLEKNIYGQEILKARELRVLVSFAKELFGNQKGIGLQNRIRFHYRSV